MSIFPLPEVFSYLNLTFWKTPVKFKVLGVDALLNVVVVMSTKSSLSGVDDIVPCTVTVPLNDCGYMAIVCNALLLLMPGRPSMDPEVKIPPDSVKAVMLVLGKNSGYAPSSNSTDQITYGMFNVENHATSSCFNPL